MAEKKLRLSPDAKRKLIEPGHPDLSLRRQCELLGLNRSSLYYEPVGESTENLHLMRLLDEQYLRTPFYGWPRMTACLLTFIFTITTGYISALTTAHQRSYILLKN